ncbi:MAG TPA: NAD(P)-binding domain-containing protein [Ktedonobacteraceae bacterium]|nr:NAD(P)-binding domain-containing protein [Ktedonobacteraceae bacterium]
MSTTIGFTGLGIMSRSVAHNLLKAGHGVAVHNQHQKVTRDRVAPRARRVDLKDMAAQEALIISKRGNFDHFGLLTYLEGLAGHQIGTH